MQEAVFQIESLPAVLYGGETDKVYLFIHGKNGCKEEAKAFAELACPLGWQVLGIDLPGHGVRKGEGDAFTPWCVVPELQTVMSFARRNWKSIALRADSIGAWFSMLAFGAEPLANCLFVSPILDMERLIQNMMQWAGVTKQVLQERETVETAFGETLSWRYYQYARANTIQTWPWPTSILYADRDNLTERHTVDGFTARFHCDLAVMERGEHWFHTKEQLEVLEQWLQTHI